ncbi:bromodomain-containing protein 2-like [Gossypium australe]|uniref:Bromodomain-containing protein 2-like n=1 Tax=Gossypium australe TaxID=47621 RepID=A0A5B6WWQ1_9ROSI|nr:bromodomain-containing protein 2-like [Gossypium australe]
MESGRKKRKMGNEEEKDDEDDDEEEEVEKFFALIRSTREMRDRLRNPAVPNGPKEEEYQKKKQEDKAVVGGGGGVGQWNPTFQAEDFMEGSISRSGNNSLGLNVAGPSSSKVQREPEKRTEDDGGGEGGGGLDLKLSLSL